MGPPGAPGEDGQRVSTSSITFTPSITFKNKLLLTEVSHRLDQLCFTSSALKQEQQLGGDWNGEEEACA